MKKLLIILSILILNSSLVLAQAQAPSPPGIMEVLGKMFPMLLIVFGIFYFMVLSPKRKELEAQKSLVAALQKGDLVTTTGGILGRVSSVENDHILIESTASCKLKIDKNHITKKL